MLNKYGYRKTYQFTDMLDDMSRQLSDVNSTVNELIHGIILIDENAGYDIDTKWDDIKTVIETAVKFGKKALYFFDSIHLSYDDIPEDADEDEVRTSHAISLLEKL